jgi:hypothetical protein
MGNKTLTGNSHESQFPGCHCFYIHGKKEIRCYLMVQDDMLLLMQADKKNGLKSIKLDQNFKVTSEVLDKRSLIISHSSGKVKASFLLRIDSKEHFNQLCNFFKSLSRPVWDDKSSLFCKICAREFTFFRRQHHCRNCGKVVCSNHGSQKVDLKFMGYSKDQRVCSACFKILTAKSK